MLCYFHVPQKQGFFVAVKALKIGTTVEQKITANILLHSCHEPRPALRPSGTGEA